MTTLPPGPRPPFRYISQNRTPLEDRRFVTGQGRFVQDVSRPGMKSVAVLASPYPCAHIRHIDISAARAMPGVVDIVTGADIAAVTKPLANPLDTPGVRCFPLAHEKARYAGEWVAAVVADDRYQAEDALEAIDVDYEPADYVVDALDALRPDAPVVHDAHGSNILYQRQFTWGQVDELMDDMPHQLAFSARWRRNATVPIETFGVVAEWHAGDEILDIWASIQMPSYAEQIAQALQIPVNQVRAHYDIDVGGSYGVKRGIKQTVLAGYLARRTGYPIRFIEDRLDNMTGGDAHGPDRHIDIAVGFDTQGRIHAMRLKVIDDVGGHTGRAPLQLGKPVGAIVGPYRIRAVAYEAISVATNKTGQIAVRGFGQSPTNFALESAIDRVARFLDAAPEDIRRINFIPADAFPYVIPSGSAYDSGDYVAVMEKAIGEANLPALRRRRDEIRQSGGIAGIGIATCLEPGGGNSAFEPLLNPKNDTTTWPESCRIRIDRQGGITAAIATSTSGQGHETLAATVIGEVLHCDPAKIRVVHDDTLTSLPGNTPVASRMAIMLGGAAFHAAEKIKAQMTAIAAHRLEANSVSDIALEDGMFFHRNDSARKLGFSEIAMIAHRRFHLLPPNMEPGLQANAVYQVPLGGRLPTPDGRVQMYPCYSFACHIVLLEIDNVTAKVQLRDYTIAHDCGTIINPHIVEGMVIGGTAQGIGAALLEYFCYSDTGQLLNASFADYLLPSAHDIPPIRLTEHCTPSPLTVFGQKGVGEGGYLAAPAAIANAVNDALSPHGQTITTLPMRPVDLAPLLPLP